jgi:hypothetical protein
MNPGDLGDPTDNTEAFCASAYEQDQKSKYGNRNVYYDDDDLEKYTFNKTLDVLLCDFARQDVLMFDFVHLDN